MMKASFKARYEPDKEATAATVSVNIGDFKLRASLTDATIVNGPSLNGLALAVEKPGFFIVDYNMPKKAKWFNAGYTLTLAEYLENAKVSISSPTIISQVYFTLPNSTERTIVENMFGYHKILYLSGMILRLADDLGTTQFELKRGDVQKAIQCYMIESNATEEEGAEHVRFLLQKAWKEMNTAMADPDCPLSHDLVDVAANLGMASHFIYLEGDGHGIQHSEIHNQMGGLMFEVGV